MKIHPSVLLEVRQVHITGWDDGNAPILYITPFKTRADDPVTASGSIEWSFQTFLGSENA